MIYTLSQDLEEGLRARKFPVAVVYGERVLREFVTAGMVITAARDTERGDSVGDPIGSRGNNPAQLRTRQLGVVLHLHVASPLAGARINEHEHDCDALVDAVITELLDWVTATRAGTIVFDEARYLSPEEINGAEHSTGVVYRMRFRVPRGVTRRDYEGLGRPTATLAGVVTATHVKREGQSEEII